jgi:hypothetical protein
MLALHPPGQLMRALVTLSFRLARRPGDLLQSYAGLRDTLTATAGVDLEKLLAGTDRIAAHADPDTGKPVLQSRSNEPGDSVRDALWQPGMVARPLAKVRACAQVRSTNSATPRCPRERSAA